MIERLGAVAVAVLLLTPAASSGQMGSGMRAAGGMMDRPGDVRVAPPPASPAAVGPRSMEHPPASRPFYLERTFLVLLGVGTAAGGFVVYRAARARWHRRVIPAGFVTEAVLVVDLVGSTHLATHYGDALAMRARTIVKDRILAAAAGHGLVFTESTGDGSFATFLSVEGAIGTAAALLDDLKRRPPDLSPGPALDVRVGVAWGEILLDARGARHGAVINKAFRLEGLDAAAFVRMQGDAGTASIPDRNRIFVDEAAAEEARAAGVSLRTVGFASLKGFPGLHQISELVA